MIGIDHSGALRPCSLGIAVSATARVSAGTRPRRRVPPYVGNRRCVPKNGKSISVLSIEQTSGVKSGHGREEALLIGETFAVWMRGDLQRAVHTEFISLIAQPQCLGRDPDSSDQ